MTSHLANPCHCVTLGKSQLLSPNPKIATSVPRIWQEKLGCAAPIPGGVLPPSGH